MKLLRLRDKLINWDLVTDITFTENKRSGKTVYIKFGAHRLRLDTDESRSFEK